jgi:lipoprotein NlpD
MKTMMFTFARHARCARSAALICAALILAACSSPNRKAPVEERAAAPRAAVVAVAPAASAPEAPRAPPPGIENAGKPGYYTVKPGDTLIRIGLDSGQNWRDIARWNGMDNPNVIEVGQVLRVVAPGIDPSAQATRAIVAGKVESRPLDAKPGATAASGAASGVSAAPATAAVTPPAAREGDDNLAWHWPASAPIAVPFDGARNKGVQFRGKAGDPVLAAADGKVIYAGSGLRGYGNFVIVQHNSNFLSVYAHNQALLVKEDQPVRRGQKIAEMGATEAEQVQLHFEIRRQGKAVDPASMLPPR